MKIKIDKFEYKHEKQEPGNRVYFLSDPHLGHRRAMNHMQHRFDLYAVDQDKEQWATAVKEFGLEFTRKNYVFSNHSVENMDNMIIDKINSRLHPNGGDKVVCLGDFTFAKGVDRIRAYRDRINSNYVQLVRGNHDYMKFSKHESLDELIFQRYTDTWSRKFEGINFFLSHYSHRVWNHQHHGAIHLFGHSHGGLDQYQDQLGMSMDVGWDAQGGRCDMWSVEEILEFMKDKTPVWLDHHQPGCD